MPGTPFPINQSNLAVAVAFRNTALIADKVLPYNDSLTSEKFAYKVHDMAQGFTLPDTKVGRKSDPNTVSFKATEVAAMVEGYGLSDFIPQNDINTAPKDYDPLNRSIEGIMDLVLLDREKRVSDLVFNAANYAAGYKIDMNAGANKSFDEDGSDPIEVISSALDAMIMRANKMVIGRPVYTLLRQHPKMIAAVKGNTGGGLLNAKDFADLFELEECIVGEAFINSNKPGQAMNSGRVWGKHIALIHQNPNSANDTTFGFTARFKGRIVEAQTIKKTGLTGGVEVWAGEKVKEVLCSPYLGYFIQNAIA